MKYQYYYNILITGKCPKGYHSCHSCCELSEDDLCKCDVRKGALPKRPCEIIILTFNHKFIPFHVVIFFFKDLPIN